MAGTSPSLLMGHPLSDVSDGWNIPGPNHTWLGCPIYLWWDIHFQEIW
jgi:hypothetical protein